MNQEHHNAARPADRSRPGRPVSAGAKDDSRSKHRRRSRKGAAVSRGRAAAIWTTPIRWRATCCATPRTPRTRCRNVTCARSGISTAIAATGDEALAVRDPAQRLPRRCRRATAPTSARSRTWLKSAERRRCGREPRRRRRRRSLRRWDSEQSIRRLVEALAEPFAIRSCCVKSTNLSYREIAEVAEARRSAPGCRGWRAPGRCCDRHGWRKRRRQQMTCDEAENLCFTH